jgi:hypothetical protein
VASLPSQRILLGTHSRKRCVLKHKEDGVLDKNSTIDNVHKHYTCINVQLSQNFRFIIGLLRIWDRDMAQKFRF